MNGVLVVAFVIMLIGVAVSDIKRRVIPNGFILMIGMLAVMAMIFQDNLTFTNRLIGFLCVSLPLLMITMFVPNAFGSFGGGDIKLMAVSGFYLGVHLILLSFFFGLIGGGLYGIILLLAKKKEKKEHIPLGPFLCLGMVIALFFGTQIIDWYLS